MTVLHRPTNTHCQVIGRFWDYWLIIDEIGQKKYIDPLEAYKEGYDVYDDERVSAELMNSSEY